MFKPRNYYRLVRFCPLISQNCIRVFAICRRTIITMEMEYWFFDKAFNIIIVIQRENPIVLFKPSFYRFSHGQVYLLNVTIIIYSIQHHLFKAVLYRSPDIFQVIIFQKENVKNKQPVFQTNIIIVLNLFTISSLKVLQKRNFFSRHYRVAFSS